MHRSTLLVLATLSAGGCVVAGAFCTQIGCSGTLELTVVADAWAEGTYESIRGPIRVRWEHQQERFNLKVTIPANTRATVYVPADPDSEVMENGQPAARSPGVTFLQREGQRMLYAIESGSYQFESR